MIFRKPMLAFLAVLSLCLAPAVSLAQENPFEVDIDPREVPTTGRPEFPAEAGDDTEIFGATSFGMNGGLPEVHDENLGLPPFDINDLVLPPDRPGPKRLYITIYYYGIRPWLVNPYTGKRLHPTDLIREIQTDNPAWQEIAKGKSLEELMEVDPTLGEPLVRVEDGGLVHEFDSKGEPTAAAMEWQHEQEAELNNARLAQVPDLMLPKVRPLPHAPFYGLYCIKVTVCVPIFETTLPRTFYRYWVKWRFRRHQRICWYRWWWHRWRFINGSYVIRPWRPLCVPRFVWHRSGPSWVCTVYNVNRWRYWCLYGLRYYFPQFSPVLVNPIPRIGQLSNPRLAVPWRYIWPRPRLRYWPFRPYCTRWYWFRCVPWRTYRYFPPIFQAAVAIADDNNGAGFMPPNEVDGPFPIDPPPDPGPEMPPIDEKNGLIHVGLCGVRSQIQQLGDNDGDGATTRSDRPRRIFSAERAVDNQDVMDDKDPATGAQ